LRRAYVPAGGAFALVLGAVAGVVSCSSSTGYTDSGPDCAFRSKCPNEIQRTPPEIDACNKSKADTKCGSAFSAMESCTQTNEECLPNGKVDHDKLNSVCKSQIAAYTRCAPASAIADAGSD
jgi:hypothetical protein